MLLHGLQLCVFLPLLTRRASLFLPQLGTMEYLFTYSYCLDPQLLLFTYLGVQHLFLLTGIFHLFSITLLCLGPLYSLFTLGHLCFCYAWNPLSFPTFGYTRTFHLLLLLHGGQQLLDKLLLIPDHFNYHLNPGYQQGH